MRLGVNIDHIAYLRETRKINDPDPIVAILKRLMNYYLLLRQMHK